MFRICLISMLLSFPLERLNAQTSKGTASYYAKKFNGRKTASGELFSNDSLTAAHKTLPMGARVRVTNLSNGKQTVVRINDRLPKVSKRSIDLSQRAAKEIEFLNKGLTKVKIEVLQD